MVATLRECLPTAERRATVTHLQIAVITFLPRIEEAVPAARTQGRLLPAETAAPVAVETIAIVALLLWYFHHAIPAPFNALIAAEIGATILILIVPVVALFSGLGDAVATEGFAGCLFDDTEAAAPVAVESIAVVALLTRVEDTVPAGSDRGCAAARRQRGTR